MCFCYCSNANWIYSYIAIVWIHPTIMGEFVGIFQFFSLPSNKEWINKKWQPVEYLPSFRNKITSLPSIDRLPGWKWGNFFTYGHKYNLYKRNLVFLTAHLVPFVVVHFQVALMSNNCSEQIDKSLQKEA